MAAAAVCVYGEWGWRCRRYRWWMDGKERRSGQGHCMEEERRQAHKETTKGMGCTCVGMLLCCGCVVGARPESLHSSHRQAHSTQTSCPPLLLLPSSSFTLTRHALCCLSTRHSTRTRGSRCRRRGRSDRGRPRFLQSSPSPSLPSTSLHTTPHERGRPFHPSPPTHTTQTRPRTLHAAAVAASLTPAGAEHRASGCDEWRPRALLLLLLPLLLLFLLLPRLPALQHGRGQRIGQPGVRDPPP